jgi:hypothetical protein
MMTFEYTYQTVEEAMRAVDLGVEDTLRDQPEPQASEDSVYHDICQSIMSDCPPLVARELGRRTGVEYIKY